ncbi:hypothetical protein ACJMK2_002138 [Sinanodonta woodiana]|uniref:Uncharacterized protein n=1 Tax=Sinanodonta woodiana TaxID=1069815 RepID=A0ABD3XXM4_SINWO
MGPLEIKFLVILGVLVGLEQANAMDCYSCNSCNDPFKTSEASTVKCSGSCYKIKGKVSSSNTEVALRGCFPTYGGDKCSEGTSDGVSGTVCYCTGNLCNYALPLGSSFIVLTVAMIVYVGLR